ncbi:fluoride efflux transporter FluC [Microbacterium sp. NPDC055903]
MTLRRLLLVALGGMLGTAARLGVALLIPDVGGIPASVLLVNVVGAFLIGVLAGRLPLDGLGERGEDGLGERGEDLLGERGKDLRVFLGTGVLGGFTTYSAFAVGSVQLWSGMPLLAVLFAAASLVLGILAAFAGMRLAVPRRRA